MKPMFLLILLNLGPFALYGQASFGNDPAGSEPQAPPETYPSTALTQYTQQQNEVSVRQALPTVQQVLAFEWSDGRIESIAEYAPYADSISHWTPYFDSLEKALTAQLMAGKDQPWNESREQLAGVDRLFIIKHERRDSLEAFIYTSNEFTNFSNAGFWIACSKDGGHHWQHYFTGLYENQPVALKWYSQLPLIVDDHTVQIEAALVRQTEPFSLPVSFPSYELVKDGLLITFDLKVLAEDSDADGLTDIVEQKLRTDPKQADTDGDGISDRSDLNPRYHEPPQEATPVFEYILDQEFAPMETSHRTPPDPDSSFSPAILPDQEWVEIPEKTSRSINAPDSISTILIVTDDPAIRAIQPNYVRVIILSPDEYQQSTSQHFPTELERFELSPMCQVNGKNDEFLIDCFYLTGGRTYLVQRVGAGWRIKVISMTII